jgi:cytosine/adenosine deaminase-related metal-dependent hydrolase
MTLVQELHHAGVNVVCASDNVRDFWYPYGDYDLLSAWKECTAMAHLDTAPSEGCWAHLVTKSAARAMKIDRNTNGNSNNKDWVVFPKARRFSELFARPHTGPEERWIIRDGVRRHYTLPDFDELDDLMQQQ